MKCISDIKVQGRNCGLAVKVKVNVQSQFDSALEYTVKAFNLSKHRRRHDVIDTVPLV